MMTGKDLMLYILNNNLEDKPVYEDGKLLGFMDVTEAAAKFNVGVNTIFTWIGFKCIEHIMIADMIYIPIDAIPPMLEKPYITMNGVKYYAVK